MGDLTFASVLPRVLTANVEPESSPEFIADALILTFVKSLLRYLTNVKIGHQCLEINAALLPDIHWLVQIRHNLVVPEKPFFRRGCCVLKAAYYFNAHEDFPDATRSPGLFRMKRRRISSALAGVAISAAVYAAVWPHARNAGATLAAYESEKSRSVIRIPEFGARA